MKTRATTAKETARTSKDFLTKKSTQIPAKELSRIEEEQNQWENEELPTPMNNSKLQQESEESVKAAMKMKLDADNTNGAAKPLTGS